MKKLLIFLLLFAFGFGAYCGTAIYTFDATEGAGAHPPAYIATASISLPVGSYSVKVLSYAGGGVNFEFRSADNTRYESNSIHIGDTYNFNFIAPIVLFNWGWDSTRTNGTISIEITGDNIVDPAEPPVITSPVSLTKTAGTAFTYLITATGDTPITYTISPAHPLPAYLILSNGKITGTLPFSNTAYGFHFHIIATNSAGNDEKEVLVTVTAAGLPVWESNIVNNYAVGDPFSKNTTLDWVFGAPSITVTNVSALPSFLTLVNNVLSGTCSTAGTYTFELSASNPYGVANKIITLTVATALLSPKYMGPIPPVWELVKGVPFSFDLKAVWDYEDTVTISGLPSWASVTNSVLSGTVPNDETRQNITGMVMTAVNDVNPSVVTGFQFLIIGGSGFYITSPSTAQAVIGQPFSYNTTTNQSSGVSYSMSNAPAWLSCSSSGSVTGTVPEGVTGFTFTVTASHSELGSAALAVSCTAGVSGESGVAQHVIVDNFSDFGGTQWATDMKGFLANSSQEMANIKLGINTIVTRQEISNEYLSVLPNIRSDTAIIRDAMADVSHLPGIHEDTTAIKDAIDNLKLDVVVDLDEMTDLLTEIKTIMQDSPSISSAGLDLPTYEFGSDLLEFTTAYSTSEINSKTQVAQFGFVTGKLNDLLSTPSSDLILGVPLVESGLGFTENPSLNVTSNPTIAPYVSTIRLFFEIIVYIVGCCWWLTIIMGFFV